MSDTRTNAGVDNVSVFKKMASWENPGERMITLLTAGNLATTQSVLSLLEERTKAPADRSPSILEAPTMFQVARLVGEKESWIVPSAKLSWSASKSPATPRFVVMNVRATFLRMRRFINR